MNEFGNVKKEEGLLNEDPFNGERGTIQIFIF